MFPLSDENPTYGPTPLTWGLIGTNILVFIFGFSSSLGPEYLYLNYGLIPYHLTHFPQSAYPTVFSSMFLHGGFWHLAGNMLYLYIFGNNIEDKLGTFRFALFYLVCGAIAAFGHIATDVNSEIPMVGASGAISGILGAYLILFPHARVKTLVFLGFFITVARIPAVILLGLWMLFQVVNGLSVSVDGPGVAWFAHIGGFIAGMVLIRPFLGMR